LCCHLHGTSSFRRQPIPEPVERPPAPASRTLADQFALEFGERLSEVLDTSRWQLDEQESYQRLEQELATSRKRYRHLQAALRQQLEQLPTGRKGAGIELGLFRPTAEEVRAQQRGLLFPGHVEAGAAWQAGYTAHLLDVTSIVVVLTSYHGPSGRWSRRLFRRDLRQRQSDPLALAEALMRRYHRQPALAPAPLDAMPDRLARLARRGIFAYAERAVLLDQGRAPWRLGQGMPTPLELLTGVGSSEFRQASLALLARLIEHQRVVFVERATNRPELVLGEVLAAGEYAILGTAAPLLERMVELGEVALGQAREVREFLRQYGPQIGVGVYRATATAPARLFYGHRERIHEAALIALADSLLQEQEGFPLLLDLASTVAREALPTATLARLMESIAVRLDREDSLAIDVDVR